jgi:thioredoxin-like negative regulator of GroEL
VNSLILATVLCAATSAGEASDAATYAKAHQITIETGKPMVIMVGTDWCGPCQNMKKNVLPEVRKRGMLSKVTFAIVNADRQGKLAKKLIGGGPIPQLIMYRKSANGWKRRKLVGGQSVEKVETFIKQGLTMDRADKKAAKDARQTAGKIKARQVSDGS